MLKKRTRIAVNTCNFTQTQSLIKYILLFIGISLCGPMMAQGGVMALIKKLGTKIDSMSVKGPCPC